MYKKCIVRLTEEERQICQHVVKKLKGSSETVRRAQILLNADADGPNWTDTRIAEAFHCRVQTVEDLRKRLVAERFEAALNRKVRDGRPEGRPLLGAQFAHILPYPDNIIRFWGIRDSADQTTVLEARQKRAET